MLTGNTPVIIELENAAKLYHTTRGKNKDDLYDAPTHYKRWPHPAKTMELKNKREDMHYQFEIYTDGSKSDKGVGSGVAIFVDGNLTHQLRYKLAEKCSNNQAEQLAIMQALTNLGSRHNIHENQRTAAIHTDSRITLEALANPRNHHSLIENIRKEIGTLEEDGWMIHFSWVKAHNNNPGNELADKLAKEATCDNNIQPTYNKHPKSEVSSELKRLGLLKWQREWDNTNKGAVTKTFFPSVKERLSKRLHMHKLIYNSNRSRQTKIILT
jgi:ribonuclease HI